jgi:hypothetical protein
MTYARGAILALLVAGASLVPMSEASARCWRCGPGPFFLWPFAAAAAVVGTAAAVATAPVAAVAGAPYYGPGYYYPPQAYYPPPAYYSGYYYAPPQGYYYPPPARGYDPYGGAH